MADVIINGRVVPAEKGSLLGDVLARVGGPKMPCGGNGTCGKCKVFAQGALSEPGKAELEKLTPKELAEGIRLACRTVILGDCEVSFAKDEELLVELEGKTVKQGRQLLFTKIGAAVDIGTTTLAARLYDQKGELIAQGGGINPQAAFGADVISRMEKSLAGEAGELAGAVRKGIAELLTELCTQSGVHMDDIDTLVIAGNTAMLYFLTRKDPVSLSRAPFCADWLAGEWLQAKDLELPCPNARVYLPRCVSAFVGADITMAMLSVEQEKEQSGMQDADLQAQAEENRMLVDIGTNGEVVLWKKDGVFCCATAAGPAFEGAGLTMGMQGTAGAVSHVTVTPEGFCAEVIGDCEPVGICGSGVIDAVSCLLQTGDMDETGYLEEEEAVIAGKVKLLQEDIRKVQLAKSAICAGMKTMLHHADITEKEVNRLYVAGGFGSFLKLENAVAIGLLPNIEADRIRVCGNAALTGASMLLLDESLLERSSELAKGAQTQELASDPYFQDTYIEGMFF